MKSMKCNLYSFLFNQVLIYNIFTVKRTLLLFRYKIDNIYWTPIQREGTISFSYNCSEVGDLLTTLLMIVKVTSVLESKMDTKG
jgi:hypothetical protein